MDGPDDGEPPTRDAVAAALEHTERTLEHQLETVSDVEDRAIRVYRANLVLASVLAGGLAVAATTGDPQARIVDLNLLAGMALLVFGSAAVATVVLDPAGLEAGISPAALGEIREGGRDERRTLSTLLSAYESQLSANDEVLRAKGRSLYYALILGFDGLAYVAVGVLDAFVVDPDVPPVYAVALSLCALPVAVFTAKVLAFPERSGRRYLTWTGVVLAVPAAATVFEGWPFGGGTEFVWSLVPLYFLALSLVERATARLGFGRYVRALLVLVVATTVPGSLLPDALVVALGTVDGVELSLFTLASTVLLAVDSWVYYR